MKLSDKKSDPTTWLLSDGGEVEAVVGTIEGLIS